MMPSGKLPKKQFRADDDHHPTNLMLIAIVTLFLVSCNSALRVIVLLFQTWRVFTMYLIAAFKLFCFLGAWVAGTFIFPVAIAGLYWGYYVPTYILIIYYTLKIFFPATKWAWMRHQLCINHTPYCNSQNIVFDEGAEVPKDKSKTMLAVAPHGILTLGWSFLITSREFEFIDCKWLTTEILLWLPFISDFLYVFKFRHQANLRRAWGDCMSCTPAVMHKLMKEGTNLGLIPGGFEEATLYSRGKHQIYIRKRQGFIKVHLAFTLPAER